MYQMKGINDKTHKKRVWTTVTTAILPGYLFCYNRDYGTATTEDFNRTEVEKPAIGNIDWFAGVSAGSYPANSEGQWIEIYEPIGDGLVPVYTSETALTIGSHDLFLTVGSHAGTLTGSRRIAKVRQTIAAAGTVLCELIKPERSIYAGLSSRTAVQLPTAAIWDLFPLDELRRDPFKGSLLDTDFRNAGSFPDNWFVDATYAASAAGKTPTEHLYIGTGATGELLAFTTTDNQAVEGQWACPITSSGGRAWAFEVRIKQSVLTDSKGGYFVGLAVPQKLTGDGIADAGTLVDGGAIGFQLKEGDGDKIDLIYDKASQTQNEHDDDYVTQVADTYNTLGLYYNGTTIQGYVDGVSTGTAISAADIAAADFPSATILVPTLFVKAAHADDFTVSIDWMRCAQTFA